MVAAVATVDMVIGDTATMPAATRLTWAPFRKPRREISFIIASSSTESLELIYQGSSLNPHCSHVRSESEGSIYQPHIRKSRTLVVKYKNFLDIPYSRPAGRNRSQFTPDAVELSPSVTTAFHHATKLRQRRESPSQSPDAGTGHGPRALRDFSPCYGTSDFFGVPRPEWNSAHALYGTIITGPCSWKG